MEKVRCSWVLIGASIGRRENGWQGIREGFCRLCWIPVL